MSKHGSSEDKPCPLAAVDQRLSDLHRHWHAAESCYFQPDEFRIAIQAAIQTARTVSFILQAQKSLFDDFDGWYLPWQLKFRKIELMRWMVDARNTIEKRGDLETHSTLSVKILASHLSSEELETTVVGDLFDPIKDLFDLVAKSGIAKHVMRDGILRIERRWVANNLPDHELLEVVAIAYGHLSCLVHDAHLALGLDVPRIIGDEHGGSYDHEAMEGRLPCMISHGERRTLSLWLATGEQFSVEAKSVELDLEAAEQAVERYGTPLRKVFKEDNDQVGVLRRLFEIARTMFLKDHRHITVAILLKGSMPRRTVELRPEEHGHKYLIARALAEQVKLVGADAVVLIGEIWMAKFDAKKPILKAADSPGRTEALAATLVSKEGEPVRLLAPIKRVDGLPPELGETSDFDGGAHYFFAPIYEVWGRDIPADWVKNK